MEKKDIVKLSNYTSIWKYRYHISVLNLMLRYALSKRSNLLEYSEIKSAILDCFGFSFELKPSSELLLQCFGYF